MAMPEETIGRRKHVAATARLAVCYLRADTSELAEPLRHAIDGHALSHRCAAILQYGDCACKDARRPGFGQVLRALAAGTVTTVIVPTMDHLAPAGRLRDSVVGQIVQFGGRLVVVDSGPTPDPALAPAVAEPAHV